jgi:hypothetical protein
MGWLFCEPTRKDLIRHLVEGNGATVYAHCTVGNTLWTVEQGVKDRFIGCYLLSKASRHPEHCRWGYKDMCESMHPYYYTCPLSYLDMVPVASEEWRERVRRYHAARNTKFEEGDIVELKPRLKPTGLQVTNRKRQYGLSQHGEVYRFKRTHLSGRVFKSWTEFEARDAL